MPESFTIDPPVNIASNIPVRITRRNNTRIAGNRHMNSINQRRCVNILNLQYVSQCPINNNYPVFKHDDPHEFKLDYYRGAGFHSVNRKYV